MDTTAASGTAKVGKKKKYLHYLSETLRIFWILERIPANQHHIEGHPA